MHKTKKNKLSRYFLKFFWFKPWLFWIFQLRPVGVYVFVDDNVLFDIKTERQLFLKGCSNIVSGVFCQVTDTCSASFDWKLKKSKSDKKILALIKSYHWINYQWLVKNEIWLNRNTWLHIHSCGKSRL